jgi:transcriptional regulator
MYTPRSFRVDDLEAIQGFMRQHSFATIVSVVDGEPSATHLPFVLDNSQGSYGVLLAHMARANSLWKVWTDQTQALVIFTGPHAYISPSWYEQQVTVPTWNYSAVHAYGRPKLMTNTATLQALVERQVAIYEDAESSAWNRDLMKGVLETEIKAIVGFEIEIERLEAKFKFNQNRSNADQAGVMAGLERSACPFKKAAGAFMRKVVQFGRVSG